MRRYRLLVPEGGRRELHILGGRGAELEQVPRLQAHLHHLARVRVAHEHALVVHLDRLVWLLLVVRARLVWLLLVVRADWLLWLCTVTWAQGPGEPRAPRARPQAAAERDLYVSAQRRAACVRYTEPKTSAKSDFHSDVPRTIEHEARYSTQQNSHEHESCQESAPQGD